MTPPDSTTLEMHGTHDETGGRHGWRRRGALVRIAVAAAAALVAFTAVVASGGAATTHTIAVGAGGDDRMSPRTKTIAQGDTVVFSWQDGGHDFVLAGPESTNVGENDEGFRLTRTFNRPGDYSFLCTLHDNMTGTLTVTPSSGAPQNPPPPAVDVVVNPDGDDAIAPADITVAKGTPVNWHWGEGGVGITFADGPSSGNKSMGSMWSRTFDTVGTYSYRSSRGSTATVKVVEQSASTGSGITPAPGGSTPSAQVTVGGSGNSFAPASVSVDEGQSVRWTWSGGTHNVRFQDGTDSGFKSTGTHDLKFSTPGTFSYVCSAHSGMSGSVTVRDTGAAGPNETPPPSGGGTGGGTDPGTGGGTNPDEGDPGTTPAASEVTVGGSGDVFTPSSVTVQTGQSVKWNWAGGVHNVTFADGTASTTKSTGTFTRRFLNPGTYAYECTLHSGMTGTVVAQGEAVPDDGTGTPTEEGGAAGQDGAADGTDATGSDATTDATASKSSASDSSSSSSSGSASGSPLSAAATTAAQGAAGPDATRPTLDAVRLRLTGGRAARRLAITLSEDAKLTVTMRALGRSNDLVGSRKFTLTGRQGANALRLPVMNLSAKRYRLRIVAVDAAGNKSAARTLIVRVA